MDQPLLSDRLKIADGRHVGFSVWGDSNPAASAVVHCHGTPGGRLVPYDLPVIKGRRHVSLDRPGFGFSDPHPSRIVGDHAGDVEQVLDHLGIDRFSAFGWSGGGPHALALGALLPDRVVRVAIFGCPAPNDDPSFDPMIGGPEMNRESRTMLKENPEEDRREVEKAAEAFLDDPPAFIDRIAETVDPVDAVVFREPGQQARFIKQLRDAFQNGAEGWFEDDMITVRPWGFAPEDVRVKVRLLHGELDRLVPISHARHLVARLPRCEGLFLPEDGHISLITRIPQILDWR